MSFSEISPQQLKEKLENGADLFLLDVRETYEYEEDNLGAELIPLGTLMLRIPEIEQHKDREIVVHCRSGSRSAVAQQFLLSQGFKNVSNLAGGIMAYREQIK